MIRADLYSVVPRNADLLTPEARGTQPAGVQPGYNPTLDADPIAVRRLTTCIHLQRPHCNVCLRSRISLTRFSLKDNSPAIYYSIMSIYTHFLSHRTGSGYSPSHFMIFGRPYRSRLCYTMSSVCRLSVTFCIEAKRCILE